MTFQVNWIAEDSQELGLTVFNVPKSDQLILRPLHLWHHYTHSQVSGALTFLYATYLGTVLGGGAARLAGDRVGVSPKFAL